MACLVVLDRDLAQVLLDGVLGLLDRVLVGRVGAGPGGVLAVGLEQAVDLGERLFLLADLLVGLDDLGLVVRIVLGDCGFSEMRRR